MDRTNWTLVALLASCWTANAASLPRLRISDNHRFFVKEDGTPFFFLADTAWGLLHFERDDVELYLKDRAAKRFTVIQTAVLPFGGLDAPNFYGEPVFVKGKPGEPNEAFFKNADSVINRAESLGFYVALVPIWASYVNQKTCVLTKETAFRYGRFLGHRYRDKPIIWLLGGDWFPDGVEDIWRSMAAGLTDGDGGTHLKTYHPTGQQSSSYYFHDDAWLDFNMVQSRHIITNRGYELVAEDYLLRGPVKPVMDGESVYEGITSELLHYKPGVEVIQDYDVRRAAYTSVLAGGAGVSYGSHGIWDYTGANGEKKSRGIFGAPITFQEALARPAGSQMQYLRALIESRPMLLRTPDQWFIASDPKSMTERVQGARASDGSYAFIYTSMGRPVRIRFRDKIHEKMSGSTIRAYWYDPRTGASTLIGDIDKTKVGDTPGDFSRGDVSREFTPPGSGPGQDWVLVLDDSSKHYPAPGSRASGAIR